jgi:hypothetical protein
LKFNGVDPDVVPRAVLDGVFQEPEGIKHRIFFAAQEEEKSSRCSAATAAESSSLKKRGVSRILGRLLLYGS